MKKRDIGQEVLDSIRDIKNNKGIRRTVINVPKEILAIRKNMDLSQAGFAELLGVSKRTLQEWEQDRCKPGGAALKLLLVAKKHPEALLV